MNTLAPLQMPANDVRTLVIRCTNGHGMIAIVPRETTIESPEIRALVRRINRRTKIN